MPALALNALPLDLLDFPDDGRGDLILSANTPGVPIVSRIIRDHFIPELRDAVAKVLREARTNRHPVTVALPGAFWLVQIGSSTVTLELATR